jgi:hypothetical protein
LPGGIRFGVLPIEMYYYTIGYNYKIEILTEKEEIISISTKVYFGLGANKRINMYNDIIDSLWTLHFEDLLNEIDDKHLNGSEISIGDITLKQEGANLLSGKKKFVLMTSRLIIIWTILASIRKPLVSYLLTFIT